MKAGKPGEKENRHWVALFWNSKNSIEFFDSYGRNIREYTSFRAQRVSKCNKVAVQQNTSLCCGEHYLYFLYHRILGTKFGTKDCVRKYSLIDLSVNDRIVKHFVCTTFSYDCNLYQCDVQISVKRNKN